MRRARTARVVVRVAHRWLSATRRRRPRPRTSSASRATPTAPALSPAPQDGPPQVDDAATQPPILVLAAAASRATAWIAFHAARGRRRRRARIAVEGACPSKYPFRGAERVRAARRRASSRDAACARAAGLRRTSVRGRRRGAPTWRASRSPSFRRRSKSLSAITAASRARAAGAGAGGELPTRARRRAAAAAPRRGGPRTHVAGRRRDGGDVEPRVCSEDGCDATPTFGSAVDGSRSAGRSCTAGRAMSRWRSHSARSASSRPPQATPLSSRPPRSGGSRAPTDGPPPRSTMARARAAAPTQRAGLRPRDRAARRDGLQVAARGAHLLLSCRRAALPRRETAMLERALTPLLAAGPATLRVEASTRGCLRWWRWVTPTLRGARTRQARAAGVPLDAAGANALVRASCDASTCRPRLGRD